MHTASVFLILTFYPRNWRRKIKNTKKDNKKQGKNCAVQGINVYNIKGQTCVREYSTQNYKENNTKARQRGGDEIEIDREEEEERQKKGRSE